MDRRIDAYSAAGFSPQLPTRGAQAVGLFSTGAKLSQTVQKGFSFSEEKKHEEFCPVRIRAWEARWGCAGLTGKFFPFFWAKDTFHWFCLAAPHRGDRKPKHCTRSGRLPQNESKVASVFCVFFSKKKIFSGFA
jgi:hypothetical protein